MTPIFDAGALIALEGNGRAMWERLRLARLARIAPVTHGGVIGQVWRGGIGAQSRLAAALKLVRVIPLDDELGRAAGRLLSMSGTTDVVDAATVALAGVHDEILTSDAQAIQHLVASADRRVAVNPV